MPDADSILPTWLALPVGAIVLILLAGHLLFLNSARDMDPRRRRIRMTNAVVMMLAVPVATYGFGVATPSNARPFIYVWVITAALLLVVIMIAMIDILHSWTLHRAKLRDIRIQLRADRAQDLKAAMLGIQGGRRSPDEPTDHARN